MLKLIFKEIVELDVQYSSDEVKKFTFGIGECIMFSRATGMIDGVWDLIPRDFRDYYLPDGTVILNVPTRCVRLECADIVISRDAMNYPAAKDGLVSDPISSPL